MLPWDSFGLFTVTPNQIALVPGVATEIAKLNPRRIALLISLSGAAADVSVLPSPQVTASFGHVLKDKYSLLGLSHASYGPLVSVSWYGFIAAGAATVIVTEVVLDKNPCQQPDNAAVITSDISPLVTRANGNTVNV